jgi:hypothetical protein
MTNDIAHRTAALAPRWASTSSHEMQERLARLLLVLIVTVALTGPALSLPVVLGQPTKPDTKVDQYPTNYKV